MLSNGRVTDKYESGSCFGEQSLLTNSPSAAWVIAVSYCVLYQLHLEDFLLLQKEFKKTFDGFKQAAKLAEKERANGLCVSRHAGHAGYEGDAA